MVASAGQIDESHAERVNCARITTPFKECIAILLSVKIQSGRINADDRCSYRQTQRKQPGNEIIKLNVEIYL